jgi:hypothetical protein
MVVYEVCGWPPSLSMTSQYHGFARIRVRLGVLYQRKTGSLDVNGHQLYHRVLAHPARGKSIAANEGLQPARHDPTRVLLLLPIKQYPSH